ncbi:uncharacterized protein LOC130284782 isoform X2 [Hyla sarda]|uniref:uncharacterized protein LOC130284782 isoform X2 n=1 Tax=Hyla sarda TaxID=327740 RepID=UPI0024C3DFEB|nr:uncharacterized protein LOC130284782 isoform X2 [Hyla sarda]
MLNAMNMYFYLYQDEIIKSGLNFAQYYPIITKIAERLFNDNDKLRFARPCCTCLRRAMKTKTTKKKRKSCGCRGGAAARKSKWLQCSTHSPMSQSQKKKSMKLFNLSSYLLSENEINLLSKGLSFCPSSRPSDFQLFLYLNQYIRKLTLTRHFSITKNNTQVDSIPPIEENINSMVKHVSVKTKSFFYPIHHRGNYLDTFYAVVQKEFMSLCEKKSTYTFKDNLTN